MKSTNTTSSQHLNLQVDAYKDMPLPEDYEITKLLSDIIMGRYADVSEDGKSLVRNGIILPIDTAENRAWRVVAVDMVGPNVTQVKTGDHVLIPSDKGIQAISKNGKMIVFFNEERIFGVCKKVENAATTELPKKTKNK